MPKGHPRLVIANHKQACEFQAERKRANDVVSWNISQTNLGFVATPRCAKARQPLRLLAPSIEAIRRQIPPGLTYYPGDGETIEVWI